jgi:hypothetical protein
MFATLRCVTTFQIVLMGFPRMNLTFPLAEGIALRLNLSSRELKGYVSGNLTVDMNPEHNVSSAVLTASARYSNLELFKASCVCLTLFRNATEIMIHVRTCPFVERAVKG